jgi:3-hydroxyisobutyrate dehydrogenase-like beta-hydroxyacid dehydrogenase
MARRIIDAGYPVTLWARQPATLEPFADTGAKTAGSAAELAEASDLVCVCVVADADVEEVVAAPGGVLDGLAEGGVIAVHSTVHPDTCRRLAGMAAARGVRLIDAPVSGGIRAETGHLLVMVSGDTETVEYCRPVFASYADPIVHLGPTGAGQIAKLLNNLLFTAHLGTAVSLLGLGQSLGVDPLRLADVITNGSGDSFALQRVPSAGGTLDRIAANAGALLRKDISLVAGLAAAAGVPGGTVLAAADDALARMNSESRPC